MGTSAQNRRTSRRVEHCLPAWYRADCRNFRRSSVLDVSEGGARLVTFDPLPENGEVHLTVRLEGQEHVTVVGRRAWQRRLRRGYGYLVGVRFDGDGPDTSTLRRWVRRRAVMDELQGVA
ncbi:MAG: PilZ domain-containing protein [Candidatus Eremiobacterota bacterium]